MNYMPKTEADVNIQPAMITLSPDGYVRLTLEAFEQITLVHLLSGLDEDDPAPLREGAICTEITGYTEWVSTTTPVISVGWDWMLRSFQGQAHYKKSGEPRSNLMLIDSQQRDLGTARTTVLLEQLIDGMAWQDEVKECINRRYAS
jgi:hypothetical protein